MAGIADKHMFSCGVDNLNSAEVVKGREVRALVFFQWAEAMEALPVAIHIDQELVKLIQVAGSTCRESKDSEHLLTQ